MSFLCMYTIVYLCRSIEVSCTEVDRNFDWNPVRDFDTRSDWNSERNWRWKSGSDRKENWNFGPKLRRSGLFKSIKSLLISSDSLLSCWTQTDDEIRSAFQDKKNQLTWKQVVRTVSIFSPRLFDYDYNYDYRNNVLALLLWALVKECFDHIEGHIKRSQAQSKTTPIVVDSGTIVAIHWWWWW